MKILGPVRTLLMLATLLASCSNISFPVPPPDPERMSFGLDTAAGTASYQGSLGSAWVDSWVILRCERTGDGVVTRSDGGGVVAPSEPFECLDGDIVLIDFENAAGDRSQLCLILHDGPSGNNFECG